jgi:hypothetical protein
MRTPLRLGRMLRRLALPKTDGVTRRTSDAALTLADLHALVRGAIDQMFHQ